MLKAIHNRDTQGIELDISLHPCVTEMYKETLMSLAYVLQEGVDGDVAEFGVFSGDGAAVLAYGLHIFGIRFQARDERLGFPAKKLHLFDSFEGSPTHLGEVDKNSPSIKRGIWGPGMSRLAGKTPEECQEIAASKSIKLLGSERVQTHPGFFSESLAKIDPSIRFALAHLDCEFYDSSHDVLDFLFSRDIMTDGSVLLLSGWNSNRGSPRHGQRRAWRECGEKYDFEYSDEGSYGPLGRKFIIHKDA